MKLFWTGKVFRKVFVWVVGGLGCVGKIAALLQAWVCELVLCGLQMCCNVLWIVEVLSVS
jgi:hypothetical protein